MDEEEDEEEEEAYTSTESRHLLVLTFARRSSLHFLFSRLFCRQQPHPVVARGDGHRISDEAFPFNQNVRGRYAVA